MYACMHACFKDLNKSVRKTKHALPSHTYAHAYEFTHIRKYTRTCARRFKDLNKSVRKTSRVLAAEQRASVEKKELKHYVDTTNEHQAKSANDWHLHQAVPAVRLYTS